MALDALVLVKRHVGDLAYHTARALTTPLVLSKQAIPGIKIHVCSEGDTAEKTQARGLGFFLACPEVMHVRPGSSASRLDV
jgi:hypothetical protein